jgi:hypothetical protein
MAGRNHVGYPVGKCNAHGKGLYTSRSDARAAIRRTHTHRAHAYPCTHMPGYWHFGHKPQAVMYGLKTRAEVYRNTA